MRDTTADAKVITLTDAGHLAQLDQSEAFAALARESSKAIGSRR